MQLITFALFFAPALALGGIDQPEGNYTDLSDIFPPMVNFSSTHSPSHHPLLGGMNLAYCCFSAFNAGLRLDNGSLIISDPKFFSPGTTATDILNADQFPCTAVYNGDHSGSPVVRSSFRWCNEQCPGWQISKYKKIQQWIGPMVAFIFPCLVFCLSIPRRRKLEVSDKLFMPRLDNTWSFFMTPLRFLVAATIVLTDTIIWLCLCFAFAGPMILSGVFEAFLDSRILDFVHQGLDRGKLDKNLATRLLYIILVGNLDFKWISEGSDVETEEDPWNDLERLLQEPHPSTRLPSMLDTQTTFGSAVGVPIVFFAGGFLYTLFDILTNLGNNDIAHALAFGMWWMTIPHVAIISSLLLAGNNPSTFQSAVSTPTIKHPPTFHLFALSFRSRYKTQWMWFRGRSKSLWLQRLLSMPTSKSLSENQLSDLRAHTNLTLPTWLKILLLATLPLFIPFLLAFLTSYYTPQKGLSCRSLTFLLYFITQTLQISLWIWVLSACTICPSGKLHSPTRHTKPSRWNFIRCIAFWSLASIFGIASIFTAIGGTIMQLVGVYRNCLCALPVWYWRGRSEDGSEAYVNLSTDSAAVISAAHTWWVRTGAVAVGFLCLSTYWGWWYQRRLRGMFREVAEIIEGVSG
ncbi:hypothetical protein BKA64DRAFT_748084 [Cadophora sp. MPI-SDFR-AT-0126]|nr:hypothetical protein BKA64DRAFT_748084 [Leotiomycetes sp. MPI-SDFR-AT-0126]